MSIQEFNGQMTASQQMLSSFAYSLTQNQEDSSDLVQDTFYRALNNREKFQPGTNLKAWLVTIMRNIFINNYRKKSRNRVILDDTSNDYFINLGGTVSNRAENNLTQEIIEDAMDSINQEYRVPFVMYFEGFKYHEIAETLDLPLGTVKSRIFLARKALRQELLQSGIEHSSIN